jgi:hypothetical protein
MNLISFFEVFVKKILTINVRNWPIVVPRLGLYSVDAAYPVLLGLIVLDRIDARRVSMDAVGP